MTPFIVTLDVCGLSLYFVGSTRISMKTGTGLSAPQNANLQSLHLPSLAVLHILEMFRSMPHPPGFSCFPFSLHFIFRFGALHLGLTLWLVHVHGSFFAFFATIRVWKCLEPQIKKQQWPAWSLKLRSGRLGPKQSRIPRKWLWNPVEASHDFHVSFSDDLPIFCGSHRHHGLIQVTAAKAAPMECPVMVMCSQPCRCCRDKNFL
jgi:hypothetical protein